jgi:hypothetical protein
MDAIDPLKAASIQGLPVTEEIARAAKQKFKEARMETLDDTSEAGDVSDLSPEAAKLSQPLFEAFLEVARENLLQMDRNSETYLPEATQKLVSGALEKKFGEKFSRDPGYQQMQAKVTAFILNDEDSRHMVEDLLDLIHLESASKE